MWQSRLVAPPYSAKQTGIKEFTGPRSLTVWRIEMSLYSYQKYGNLLEQICDAHHWKRFCSTGSANPVPYLSDSSTFTKMFPKSAFCCNSVLSMIAREYGPSNPALTERHLHPPTHSCNCIWCGAPHTCTSTIQMADAKPICQGDQAAHLWGYSCIRNPP